MLLVSILSGFAISRLGELGEMRHRMAGAILTAVLFAVRVGPRVLSNGPCRHYRDTQNYCGRRESSLGWLVESFPSAE
jgi:hypothetical protein